MKCKNLHKNLIFYFEGELPASEMEEIKVHLLQCSECASFAKELKKSLAIFETEKSFEINPFFYTRLKAKMENQETKATHRLWQPIFVQVLQPLFFSLLLFAGIYTGIKIGEPTTINLGSSQYSEQEIIPYLNEMETEPIEAFLME